MRRIIEMMSRAAGDYKPQWYSTVRTTVVGGLLNGIAIVLLLPLVYSLLTGNHELGWWILLALGVLLVLETIARVGEVSFAFKLYPDLMEDMRLRIGQHLRRIPSEELARRRSGEISTVLNQDVNVAFLSVSDVSAMFVRLLVIPGALVIALFVIDWRLLLGTLLGAVIIAIALARQNASLARTQREVGTADAETADRIVEYVQGLPVLKAAGQVGEHSERLVNAMNAQGRALNRSINEATLSLTGAAIGANLAVAGVVAVGAALVLAGELPAVAAAAVVVAAAGLAEPLARAAALSAVFESSAAAMERIDAVLSIEPLPVPDEPAQITAYDVGFGNVTFTYHGSDQPALRNVTLAVPEKALTALVGPSGSGKTTLTRLISRFADPQSGTVRIGGVDIRDVTERELMSQLATVFQDVHLFNTTIYENVAMARPGATEAEVLAALEAANCNDFISRLTDGTATIIGESGNELSGGERQRVSIARALLKDAPIVLLDEPTSALDTESEVMVQGAIDRLVADRTVIVIAHRLSTIVAADQIVVFDEGSIIEQGDHESLIAADGRYAAMWRAQTRARGWTVAGR